MELINYKLCMPVTFLTNVIDDLYHFVSIIILNSLCFNVGNGIQNLMVYSNCVFRANQAQVYAGLWLASVDPYSTQFNHKPVEITNRYVFLLL